MLGFYDYTVILTYISLLSAGTGILVSLAQNGHPYLGVLFLLICGLCDSFDGKVARTKKNRTKQERSFGIQIDSLSDLVAFGVLPACIGGALYRSSPFIKRTFNNAEAGVTGKICSGLLFAVLLLYILAALIRLAYFNVTEEERQEHEQGRRKQYTGLPVTSAALIFPTVMLLQYVFKTDLVFLFFALMLLTAFAFLAPFHMKKPGMRGIIIMVCIGAAEFIAFLVMRRIFA